MLVLSQLSPLQQRPVVRVSIIGAALFLLAWSVLLFGVLRRRQKVTLDILLRRQHYLQACLQGSLILYWGYYWREVYHAAPLIAAQILFAYGFDSLLVVDAPPHLGARLRPVSRHLQHHAVLLVQGRLVLPGSSDWSRSGLLAKEFLRWTARRREHAHLQPLVIPARRGVGAPAGRQRDAT